MARVQTQDLGAPERIQVNTGPAPVLARTSDVGAQKADALVRSLSTINPALQQFSDTLVKKSEDEAKAFAASITAKDLEDRIRNGEMLPSQSPVFVATLQHINGRNAADKLAQDTQAAMERGELKFNSTDELDQYLIERKGSFSEGQSKYGISGFDKSFEESRARMRAKLVKDNSDEAVQSANLQAKERLGNVVAQVTDKPEDDQVAAILASHGQTAHMLPTPAMKRDAISHLMTTVADTGQPGVVEKLLASRPEGSDESAPTLGTILGPEAVQALKDRSERIKTKNEEQTKVDSRVSLQARFQDGSVTLKEVNEALEDPEKQRILGPEMLLGMRGQLLARAAKGNADQEWATAKESLKLQVRTGAIGALMAGDLSPVQSKSVMKADGTGTFEVSAESAIGDAIDHLAEHQGIPLERKIEVLAKVGRTSPRLDSEFKAFSNSLGRAVQAVQRDENGKPMADVKIDPEFVQRMAQMDKVHATNPQYMQRAMGEQAYDAYRSIAANAPIVGGMDKAIQLAANTMADRSPQAAEMRADMTKAAKASAADLVSSGWFGTFFQGDLGGVKNKWQVQNELTKLAGVAIQTGARSPEEAMQRAQEQIKANYIAVDGSLINKAQFPQLAKGDDFRKVVEEGKSVLVQRAGLTAGQSSNYDIVQTMTMSDGEPVFELRDSQGRTVRSPSGKPAMVTGREFPEFAKNITKRQFERIREAQSAVPLDFQTFPSP